MAYYNAGSMSPADDFNEKQQNKRSGTNDLLNLIMVMNQQKKNQYANQAQSPQATFNASQPKQRQVKAPPQMRKPQKSDNNYRQLMREWAKTGKMKINDPMIHQWLNISNDKEYEGMSKKEAEGKYVQLLSEWGYKGMIDIQDDGIMSWLRSVNNPSGKVDKELEDAIKNNPHIPREKIISEYESYKKLK